MRQRYSKGEWKYIEAEDGEIGVQMGNSHTVWFANMEGACGECLANAKATAALPKLIKAIGALIAANNCNYMTETMRYQGLFKDAEAALDAAGVDLLDTMSDTEG